MPNNQLIFSDEHSSNHGDNHSPSLTPHIPDNHFHGRWDDGDSWEGWHPHCHPEPPSVPEPQTWAMS